MFQINFATKKKGKKALPKNLPECTEAESVASSKDRHML